MGVNTHSDGRRCSSFTQPPNTNGDDRQLAARLRSRQLRGTGFTKDELSFLWRRRSLADVPGTASDLLGSEKLWNSSEQLGHRVMVSAALLESAVRFVTLMSAGDQFRYRAG